MKVSIESFLCGVAVSGCFGIGVGMMIEANAQAKVQRLAPLPSVVMTEFIPDLVYHKTKKKLHECETSLIHKAVSMCIDTTKPVHNWTTTLKGSKP